jgi:hypothetical protein
MVAKSYLGLPGAVGNIWSIVCIAHLVHHMSLETCKPENLDLLQQVQTQTRIGLMLASDDNAFSQQTRPSTVSIQGIKWTL